MDEVIIRPLQENDLEPVSKLFICQGMRPLDKTRWQLLFIDNPAMAEHPQHTPGWLIQSGQNIVGAFLNIPLLAWMNQEKINICTMASFCVMPDFRHHSLELAVEFFEQEGTRLLIDTTASEAVAKIFELFKGHPMPQSTFIHVDYWVIRDKPFLNSALQIMNWPKTMAVIASSLLLFPFKIYKAIRQPYATCLKHSFVQFNKDTIGTHQQAYQQFWNKVQSTHKELLHDRCVETLMWHLEVGGHKEHTECFLGFNGEIVETLLILGQDRIEEVGLSRLKIVDLITLNQEPQSIVHTLNFARTRALERNADILEFYGGVPATRNNDSGSKAFHRTLENNPYCFAFPEELEPIPELNHAKAWYPTLYDGDSSL